MIAEFSWSQFHLLRPQWLLALPPLLLAAWWMLRHRLFSRGWQAVIDPQLLPHVLMGRPGRSGRLPVLLFVGVGCLVIIALAGPVWSKLPQPVFSQQSALVIALDLSRSMDAGDIKPSRLTRARYKIADILKLRRDGQTALIAYAGGAFTVTPLTDDSATIAALLPSLGTDMMPAQGSRTERALQQAEQLLANAGIVHGDVLLVTDGIDRQGLSQIRAMADAGHRVSILASGTVDGAPIPLADGGFLKDARGSIVIPKLDLPTLRDAARSGGGRFSLLSADDRDIKYILGPLDDNRLSESKQTELQADVWQEQGPWLLLLALPLAALAFRRGYLVMLLALSLPWSPPADALSWDELWKNDNQIAAEKLARDQASEAAELFTDPRWRATAQYRAGEYEQAATTLQALDTADAHYNRGNALARQGDLPGAIQAYEQALEKNPQMEDAGYNKQLLEQHLENQQQENKQGQQGDNSDDQQQDSQGQNTSQQADQGQQQQQDASQSSSGKQDADQRQQNQEQGQQNNGQADDNQQEGDQQQAQQQTRQPDQAAGDDPQGQPVPTDEQSSQPLSQQAAEQWLRRIPDDPGGLLRRKFKYQYQRQQGNSDDTQPW
jgi:Ca-activated chloride channel family protein